MTGEDNGIGVLKLGFDEGPGDQLPGRNGLCIYDIVISYTA